MKNIPNTHLIHSSGYETQSIMQRYRCQDIQPIGGVNAKPLSNPFTSNLCWHTNITNKPAKNDRYMSIWCITQTKITSFSQAHTSGAQQISPQNNSRQLSPALNSLS